VCTNVCVCVYVCVCVVITASYLPHVSGVFRFGNPETTSGGTALKFYASVRLDIRRIGAIKNADGQVAGTCTCVCVCVCVCV